MAGSLWISPQAELDIAELAMYIGRQSVDAADRLFTEFYALADRLAEFPELGQEFPTSHPRLRGLRVVRVPHFPNHLVFYLCKAKAFKSFECFVAQEIWTRSLDNS
jgi:plasmid stabilization system protein ParE